MSRNFLFQSSFLFFCDESSKLFKLETKFDLYRNMNFNQLTANQIKMNKIRNFSMRKFIFVLLLFYSNYWLYGQYAVCVVIAVDVVANFFVFFGRYYLVSWMRCIRVHFLMLCKAVEPKVELAYCR